jgi:hypothetical protein
MDNNNAQQLDPAAQERERIVTKLVSMRIRKLLNIGGTRELTSEVNAMLDLRRDIARRIAHVEQHRRVARQLIRTPQAPGALDQHEKDTAALRSGLHLLDTIIIPRISEARDHSGEAWQESARSLDSLNRHLETQLREWGIYDAVR